MNYNTEEELEEFGNFPICPYCKHKDLEYWELDWRDGDIKIIECEHCEKEYQVSLSISYNFISTSIVKKENK